MRAVPRNVPFVEPRSFGVVGAVRHASDADVTGAHARVLDHEIGVDRSPDRHLLSLERDELPGVHSREHGDRRHGVGRTRERHGKHRRVPRRIVVNRRGSEMGHGVVHRSSSLRRKGRSRGSGWFLFAAWTSDKPRLQEHGRDLGGASHLRPRHCLVEAGSMAGRGRLLFFADCERRGLDGRFMRLATAAQCVLSGRSLDAPTRLARRPGTVAGGAPRRRGILAPVLLTALSATAVASRASDPLNARATRPAATPRTRRSRTTSSTFCPWPEGPRTSASAAATSWAMRASAP